MKNEITSKRMPEGKFARALGFGSLAFKLGSRMTLNAISELAQGKKVDTSSLLFSENNFETITDTLATMRGAAMKLGQILSMENTDLLPSELSNILSRLRAKGYSMPPQQLKRILNKNWGEAWLRKFRQFETRPFAAASIGQVHKAINEKGEMIAVKVQFPNIRQSIKSDLHNLKVILKRSGLIPEGLDLDHYLEICEVQLLLETDYQREADFLRRFKILTSSIKGIQTPTLIENLSTKSILAMSLEEGIELDRLEQFSESEKTRIAMLLVSLIIHEIFDFGLVQSDPNFANYRYDVKSANIKLLDFGACVQLSPEVVCIYRKLLKSLFANDGDSILNILVQHHLVSEKLPTSTHNFLKDMIKTVLTEFHASDIFSFSESKVFDHVTAENMKKMSEIIPTTLVPVDLLLMQRKLIGLTFLLHRLGSSLPLKEILRKQIN